MINDGLEPPIDITPTDIPAEKPHSGGRKCWSGVRSVLAFPIRALTSVWINGSILLLGMLTILVGAVFFTGVIVTIMALLSLCLMAIVMFGITFGMTRISDWISGEKTMKHLPKFMQNAAARLRPTDDIGNIRAHARRWHAGQP